MNRRIFALARGLGVAAFVAPRVALAEDHLAEAISHTKEAINHGMRVAWFTLETLTHTISRAKVDLSTSKVVARICRSDLIVVDDIGTLPAGADAAEIKRPLPVTGLCAQREFLLRSRDLVTRLIQGMIEAVVSARNPRNRSDVMEVLRKNLRFDKAEDTEMSYRVLTQVSTLDVDLYEDAWRLTQRIVSRVNPKLGQVDLSQLLDRSFVRSLEESGFLPEMRKKMGS